MARLAYCYECGVLARLDDRKGNDSDIDPIGQDWIDRHMHGIAQADHKGGQWFDVDDAELGTDWQSSEPVRQAREALKTKANVDVYDLRDEVKDDALHCFAKHGNPAWPGKKCRDYKSDSKRLGSKNTPKAYQRHMCDFCPYEETVRVEKRWRAGQYR